MVLADTSVWICHFRNKEPGFAELLNNGSALMHSFVLGELACGNLKNRSAILSNLEALPRALPATHEGALRLIEQRNLWGWGIGWVDANLLASALLSNCLLWTLDDRLNRAAENAGVKWC